MTHVAWALVFAPLVVVGCDRSVTCPLSDDCCPDGTIPAAERELGVSAGDAFRTWRDLTFEGQSDDGPQIVSVALDRRATESEGYRPAGDYVCEVGLVFGVVATATVGSDEVRGIWGRLEVADDTNLLLMSDPEGDDCGCTYQLDAVLDTGPDSELGVGGSWQVDCSPRDGCSSDATDPDDVLDEEIRVEW